LADVFTSGTLFAVTAYAALLTWVALRARVALRFDDFSLARRSLPLALVFGSLAATYVGPAFSIGFVGRGFRTGYLFLGIGLAVVVQNLLVGFLIAPRLRAMDGCHTLGDVIGQKYNRSCHILAGVISVGLCTGFAGVVAKAGGQLISDTVGLPLWSAVIVVGGVTTLYTTFGGLRASVITDAFQFMAFCVLIPIILVLLATSVLREGPTFMATAADLTESGGSEMPFIDLIGWVAAFLLGETLIPPYANRALASRSTEVSRNAFILAGGFSAAWFTVMITLGILAATSPELARHIATLPADSQEDAVLMAFVRMKLPSLFHGLLLVVLMSIVMSSLDSLLNAGAVAFTRDMVQSHRPLTDRQALTVGRSATIFIAVGAMVGALKVPGILAGLRICYSLWAPAILPVLFLGLWLAKPKPLAGILSMGVGTLMAVLFEFVLPWFWPHLSVVPGILPALAGALLAYAVGSVNWRSLRSAAV
jgi:SSS family solute:Na+ symporter